MSRGPDFGKDTKRAALERSGGICECHRVPQLMEILHDKPCGVPLGAGDTFYEHIIPKEFSGDNSLDNAAVLTRTCWRLKTDIYDLPAIADAKRQEDHQFAIDGPGLGRHPMRGGRHSDESRGMTGRVKPRRTLTQKLLAAGIIHPDDLKAAR